MELTSIDEHALHQQAATAGFASPELYIQSLLERDAERLAIQEGIDAYKAGRHRPFEEFDREFRQRNGLAPRTDGRVAHPEARRAW